MLQSLVRTARDRRFSVNQVCDNNITPADLEVRHKRCPSLVEPWSRKKSQILASTSPTRTVLQSQSMGLEQRPP